MSDVVSAVDKLPQMFLNKVQVVPRMLVTLCPLNLGSHIATDDPEFEVLNP